MGLDLKTLAASKKYTSEALQGEGVTKGKDGFSPIITPNPDNNDQTYKLDIITANNSFTTPNLKGENGIINADSEEIFKSEDNLNPEKWTEVELLECGKTHGSIMTKISSMFKNIRYIWKILGTTDISKIDDGTVTGAIGSLNSNLNALDSVKNVYSSKAILSLNQDINVSYDGFICFQASLIGQYSGYAVTINGLTVDSLGVTGTNVDGLTVSKKLPFFKGDIVNVTINSVGTSLSGYLYFV